MTVRTIYNRPAIVEGVFGDVARVRFQDNGIMDYVPVEALNE